MPNKKNSKAFTLIEVLMAASIFVVVISITTTVLISTIRTEKTTGILTAVYEDARNIMGVLTNYVHNNAIDYEEYYSQNVVQENFDAPAYGLYYGVYASRFMDPGLVLKNDPPAPEQGLNPQDLGVQCSDPLDPALPLSDCEIRYEDSRDTETGQNPWDAQAAADAFCDQKLNVDCQDNRNIQDELYLISADGGKKTLFVKQMISANDNTLGMLELSGIDSDQNSIYDLYRCADGYNCSLNYADDLGTIFADYFNGKDFPGITGDADIATLQLSLEKKSAHTQEYNIGGPTTGFMPISPFRSSVKSIYFIINPVEDPYKAGEETDKLVQPSVTIVLTMEPSQAQKDNYPGGWNEDMAVTVQRTVAAGVLNKVQSYPPTNELGWICHALNENNCH